MVHNVRFKHSVTPSTLPDNCRISTEKQAMLKTWKVSNSRSCAVKHGVNNNSSNAAIIEMWATFYRTFWVSQSFLRFPEILLRITSWGKFVNKSLLIICYSQDTSFIFYLRLAAGSCEAIFWSMQQCIRSYTNRFADRVSNQPTLVRVKHSSLYRLVKGGKLSQPRLWVPRVKSKGTRSWCRRYTNWATLFCRCLLTIVTQNAFVDNGKVLNRRIQLTFR